MLTMCCQWFIDNYAAFLRTWLQRFVRPSCCKTRSMFQDKFKIIWTRRRWFFVLRSAWMKVTHKHFNSNSKKKSLLVTYVKRKSSTNTFRYNSNIFLSLHKTIFFPIVYQLKWNIVLRARLALHLNKLLDTECNIWSYYPHLFNVYLSIALDASFLSSCNFGHSFRSSKFIYKLIKGIQGQRQLLNLSQKFAFH